MLTTTILVASCQAQPGDGPDRPAPSPAGPVDYVAIGDSYTSAPLVPTTDLTDACMRSTGNYPHRLAELLPQARLTDVSCSGADTTDLTDGQEKDGRTKPPQLDALSAETDLVTVGIGANDFSLFTQLAVSCLRLAPTDPTGSPCRRSNDLGPEGDRLLGFVPRIRERLGRVIEEVRRRAPAATVVMVDYPRILPPSGTCPGLLPLADGDHRYVDRINRALSAAVRAAAEQGGVRSVDVFAASEGHDVCSDAPWVNGIRTDPGRAIALHPFATEQQAVAELILAEL